MRRIINIFLWLGALSLINVVSSFAFEINSARAPGIGGAIIQSQPTASDILRAPSLRPDKNVWYFEAGLARRFNLSELDVGYVAAVYRSGAFSYGVGLQQFGQSDNFAENTARAIFAYHPGKLSLGLSLSGVSFEFGGGYGSLRMGSIGLAAGYHHDRFLLDVSVDELNNPAPLDGAPEEPISGNIYVEALGSSSFTLSGTVRLERRAKPSLGVGQSVVLGSRARFSWGIKSEPLEYGAGFEFKKGKYSLVYAGSFHPDLGYSQNASLIIWLSGSGAKRQEFSAKSFPRS